MQTNLQHELAKKYARQGAFVRKVNIGGKWVDKCFLRKCPECFRLLPGMLTANGHEHCITPNCIYDREVYSPEELALFEEKRVY